jgi:hypothetical protein
MAYRSFNRELITTAKGVAWNLCRFTVGSTGAVGTLKQASSNSIRSITRNSAGNYTVQFNEPYPAALAYVDVRLHRAAVSDAPRVIDYDAGTYSPTAGTLVIFTSSVEDTTAGVAATGTVTCVAKASLVDTDYITIGDGVNPAVIYEFDVAGDGASVATRVAVDVSGATTAADVAALLKTAIEANQPLLTVVDAGSGVLNLTHDLLGTLGNVTITENVADAGFLVTGMSGGTNFAVVAQAAADPVQNSEFHLLIGELRQTLFDR